MLPACLQQPRMAHKFHGPKVSLNLPNSQLIIPMREFLAEAPIRRIVKTLD